jgi:hypothetical protein
MLPWLALVGCGIMFFGVELREMIATAPQQQQQPATS